MKPTGAVLFMLLFFTMTALSHKITEKYETLDVVVDKEAQRVGVEAIQVGEVLRAIANGLRATGQRQQGAESQDQEYFFGKILKAVGELAKGVGNVVQGAAEGIGNAVNALTFSDTKGEITTKAADILHKLVIKDLSLYASIEGKTYKDFRQQIADDLSRVAESLINKGKGLCSCRGRAHLDRNESKFVELVVEAL